MINNPVFAVVISFNRFEFLKKIIHSLENQTKPLDKIVVVDNGSKDGALEWLREKENITLLEQGNVGSSGGQFRGIEYAFKNNAEWIWIMDDDVVPHLDCLENLFKEVNSEFDIVAPKKFQISDGSVVQCDSMQLNLTNPFSTFWKKLVPKDDLIKSEGFVKVDGLTFEGPMFHRNLVRQIGLPEFNFFIYGDDTEYFLRANQYKYQQKLVLSAKLDRLLNFADMNVDYGWKLYYIVRNQMITDFTYGNFAVKLIRPLIYLLKWIFKTKSFKEKHTVIKAYFDALFYKQSKENQEFMSIIKEV
jgi:GT2 family glycosyltransferase